VSAAIRVAVAADRVGVCDLLSTAGLPLDGLSVTLEHFLVAEAGERIVAAAGLEVYGDSALLRSLVVAPSHRETGLGGLLTAATFAMARELGARHVYLLTNTAETYFHRRGFLVTDRADVPVGIRGSVEFSVACPASAVVMRRPTGEP
jgi:amino-acid N-acetyltransferase